MPEGGSWWETGKHHPPQPALSFTTKHRAGVSSPTELEVLLSRAVTGELRTHPLHRCRDRAQALAGALFDAIGTHFGIFAKVNRARINASDEATGQAADLECLDKSGKLILAVEVKDRTVTLADVEGTLHKSRQRQITEILFTARGMRPDEKQAIDDRISRAFTAGQSLYIFDFFDLARSVLALGGESIRITFLKKVGEHLDTWNTQPRHRQAWQKLLQRL